MARAHATCYVGLAMLWLLLGCGAQPAPSPMPLVAQPTASPKPLIAATGPARRQFLPLVAASSACPREYDEQRADGSIWHVKANCDGSFDAVQIEVPTPSATLVATIAPAAQGCPEGCSLPPPGCLIKAQISVTGEKVYQLPGWKHYATTVVDPRFGDRWFCTTAEAVANGWHASADR